MTSKEMRLGEVEALLSLYNQAIEHVRGHGGIKSLYEMLDWRVVHDRVGYTEYTANPSDELKELPHSGQRNVHEEVAMFLRRLNEYGFEQRLLSELPDEPIQVCGGLEESDDD